MFEGRALQNSHFRISDETSDKEKQLILKKRKARIAAQHAFATLMCLFAGAMVVLSLLLATGRLGWGGKDSGAELSETTEALQGGEELPENVSDTPPEIETLPEATVQPVPKEPGEDISAAAQKKTLSGMKTTVVSDPESFIPDPLYCTIWPVKDLSVYSDSSRSLEIGRVQACGMYCVLEENAEAGLFRVRTGKGETGWIDSNYCMINLTEYLGDLCSYSISNSTASMYTVHEYEIPGLSGEVITGYENVCLADGSFLVPFLYPCCNKLEKASKLAYSEGYRIKIYDSYRPKIATNSIYYTAVGIINSPLPDHTFTGNSVSLPQPGNGRNYLIYRDLIEMNGWDMGSFLAPGASKHNMGIALDMTFETADTGEEVSTQTVIHDLSAYSTIRSNNAIAAKMYKLMESCKMHNIVSEWWHFQDNEAMKSLKPPYCERGVSAEGWIADSRGERFRLSDGTVLKSCMMVTADDTLYFDAEGYLIEQ